MGSNYDSIDLYFTDEGDFAIDQDGDVKDTSENFLRSITQEVRDRVKSSLRDWQGDPHIGASLVEFLGEPSTPELVKEIKLQIIQALTFDGLIAITDLVVMIMPVGIHSLLIRIKVRASTSTQSPDITINMAYDTMTSGLQYL